MGVGLQFGHRAQEVQDHCRVVREDRVRAVLPLSLPHHLVLELLPVPRPPHQLPQRVVLQDLPLERHEQPLRPQEQLYALVSGDRRRHAQRTPAARLQELVLQGQRPRPAPPQTCLLFPHPNPDRLRPSLPQEPAGEEEI